MIILVLSEKACPDLKTPINGALVCDKFFGGETCQIQCHVDYDVPEDMKHVTTLICGSSGGWMPIPQVPDCTCKWTSPLPVYVVTKNTHPVCIPR